MSADFSVGLSKFVSNFYQSYTTN